MQFYCCSRFSFWFLWLEVSFWFGWFAVIVEASVRLLIVIWQSIFCAQEAEEDGGCLSAGGAALWGEGGFCHAADVAFVVGPEEDVVKTAADARCIGEIVEAGVVAGGGVVAFIRCVAIENGGELFAGEDVLWSEEGVAVAADDVVFFCPIYSVGVPSIISNISEAGVGRFAARIFKTIKDGNEHGAVDAEFWREGIAGGAGHKAGAIDICDILISPVVIRYIGEWQRGFVARFCWWFVATWLVAAHDVVTAGWFLDGDVVVAISAGVRAKFCVGGIGDVKIVAIDDGGVQRIVVAGGDGGVIAAADGDGHIAFSAGEDIAAGILDTHALSILVDELAAVGDVEICDARICCHDPRSVAINADADRCVALFRSSGVFADGGGTGVGGAIQQIEVKAGDGIDVDISGELLIQPGEGDIGAIFPWRAPVVRIVPADGEQICCLAVKIKGGVFEHNVGGGVRQIEHAAFLDVACEGGIFCFKFCGLASGSLGITGCGLINDHAVCDRIAGGFAGDFAGELRIFDENGVEPFHTGDLAAGGGAFHIVHLHIASGIKERRTAASGEKAGIRQRDIAAATIGRKRCGMVAGGGDREQIADHGAAIGRVQSTGIAGGGDDGVVVRINGTAIGGENSIGAGAVCGELGVGDFDHRIIVHRKQDRVDAVEITVVAIGVAAALVEGGVGEGQAAAILRQSDVLVDGFGGNVLAIARHFFAVSSDCT